MGLVYERRWESRRERRRQREAERQADGVGRSVGDEARDTYYGVPAIHRPHWNWLIITYFFLGGITSGSHVIANVARLFGGAEGRRIERAGRYVSVAALLPCPVLLILDLGRPERFINMMRIFKLRSPMSVGTWGLTVFGAISSLAAANQLARDGLLGHGHPARLLRAMPDRFLSVLGMGPAFFVGGYTGVLLAATAVPVWTKNYRLMGPLFLSSAVSSASAAISLLLALGRDNERAIGRVEQLDLLARTAELGLLAATHRTLGPELGSPLTSGTTGRVYRLGVLGTGVGAQVLALAGRRSRTAATAGSLLALLGGFLFRYVWIAAGHASADDPRATFTLTGSREGR